jgi:hypothetical protein
VTCAIPIEEDEMKKSILFTLIVLVPLLTACCGIPNIGDLIPGAGEVIQGSGNVVTQEETITGFDEVEVSQGFRVDISQGDTFSLVVRVDDNLVQYLQVVKQDNTLKIGLEPVRTYVGTLQAEVTMPKLSRLTLRHGSRGTVSGSGGDVTVEAFDGSRGDLSAFAVENATVAARGGSRLTVNVSGKLVADAHEGSRVDYLGNPTDVTTNTTGGSEISPE